MAIIQREDKHTNSLLTSVSSSYSLAVTHLTSPDDEAGDRGGTGGGGGGRRRSRVEGMGDEQGQ